MFPRREKLLVIILIGSEKVNYPESAIENIRFGKVIFNKSLKEKNKFFLAFIYPKMSINRYSFYLVKLAGTKSPAYIFTKI